MQKLLETWQVHKKTFPCNNFYDLLFHLEKVARNVAGYGDLKKKNSCNYFSDSLLCCAKVARNVAGCGNLRKKVSSNLAGFRKIRRKKFQVSKNKKIPIITLLTFYFEKVARNVAGYGNFFLSLQNRCRFQKN